MAEEKQLPLISLIVPYGIIVSSLYLFGYWSAFDINVFHYAALSDVIKLAIYPVFIGAVLSLSGFFIQALLRGHFFETEPEKVFIILSKRFVTWSTIAATTFMVIFVSLRRDGFSLVIAGLLLSYIVNVNTGDFTLLKPFIPNLVLRKFATYALVVVLFSSFGRGREDAEKVLIGKGIKTVSTAIFKGKGTDAFKSKGLLEKYSSLKYVGAAGDFFFFITPDNTETIVAKYEDLHFIEFKKK